VQLPPPEEIPNLDLEVMNFHRPVVGLMHSKFAVFDRRVALLYSSNIQDTETFEMLTRVEGPIVDSFYDSALIIWNKSIEPPLPMLDSPAAAAPIPSFSGNSVSFIASDSTADSERLSKPTTEVPRYDADITSEARRVNANLDPKDGETRREVATRHLST
jgi:phosphatidylserine/phosphatidylglycerophosphate/cardiolipin synthase-like enzyme